MRRRTRTTGHLGQAGALLVGVGATALVDGLALGLVAGWHPSPLGEASADRGVWLLGALVVVGAGLSVLYRVGRTATAPSGRRILGAVLIGSGCYVLLEGVLTHHLLDLHHFGGRGASPTHDLAYLVVGLALGAGGVALSRGDGGLVIDLREPREQGRDAFFGSARR